MPACGPVREVAATPRSCRAIASSATDWSSPVERSWSISRGEGSLLTSPASRSSRSVCFPIAETVTTRSWPDSRTFFTLSATALMCSAVATELPPYFWTMIPKDASTLLPPRSLAYRRMGVRLYTNSRYWFARGGHLQRFLRKKGVLYYRRLIPRLSTRCRVAGRPVGPDARG